MPCATDPDLKAAGVVVDRFVKRDHASFHCLTHVHDDHTRNLKSGFPGQIVCSLWTKKMLQARYPPGDFRFRVIPMEEWITLNRHVRVKAYHSFHTVGSTMFLFELDGHLKILYTGDFRFQKLMREYEDITNIDRLYYDDTFEALQTPLPTYQESLNQLETYVRHCVLTGRRCIIHVGVLGVEILLSRLAEKLNVYFHLLNSLPAWRQQQLKLLLGRRLHPEKRTDTSIGLGHWKRHDLETGEDWVVPTCTFFLCEDTPPARPNIHFVPFCSHSNRQEIALLKHWVNAMEVNPCHDEVGNLSCSRKET